MSDESNKIAKNGEITLEFVWENVSPELVSEAQHFWLAENALQGNLRLMEERARQLVVIARNVDKKLIAVSTAARIKVPALLNNTFYYLRAFVSLNHRNEGLLQEIAEMGIQRLHARFLSGEDTVVKGFYSAMESEALKNAWPEAVRKLGGISHTFIGVDEKARRLYVAWFDGAATH